MKINLLTKEQHSTILEIYKKFPSLTLQNKGYEGINRTNFADEEKKADEEIKQILKKAVVGFSSFQNFLLDKNNELQIRLQYNYNYEPNSGLPFIGVGYILLDELLNGFRKN